MSRLYSPYEIEYQKKIRAQRVAWDRNDWHMTPIDLQFEYEMLNTQGIEFSGDARPREARMPLPSAIELSEMLRGDYPQPRCPQCGKFARRTPSRAWEFTCMRWFPRITLKSGITAGGVWIHDE